MDDVNTTPVVESKDSKLFAETVSYSQVEKYVSPWVAQSVAVHDVI